jgi:nicotinamidase-related amidase
MKVSHWVETTDQEANDLYMMVVTVTSASYSSVDEQNAAILAAMPDFKMALDEMVSEAFELGFKKMKKVIKREEVDASHSS